jgi:hypothetical protein
LQIVGLAETISKQEKQDLAPIVLLLLLLNTIVASAGDASWIEGRTEHFRVIADAGENNRREAATRFEQMRAAYALLFEDERSAPQHVLR